MYDLVAYWTWGQAGWANKLGALDFAGGTPGGQLCIKFVVIM